MHQPTVGVISLITDSNLDAVRAPASTASLGISPSDSRCSFAISHRELYFFQSIDCRTIGILTDLHSPQSLLLFSPSSPLVSSTPDFRPLFRFPFLLT